MKYIELSQTGKHKSKYVAIVDDEDYERVMLNKWCVSIKHKGKIIYARRFLTISKNNRIELPLHRFVMNVKDGYYVDHIDGNGLNNLKSNLRICTQKENAMNRSKHKEGTCIYKGVIYEPNKKLFRARIRVDNKLISLGRHKKPENAAIAYNDAALIYFGEFAKLNVIEKI